MSDQVKDEVKTDIFIFIYTFLKLKQMSILISKSEQGMEHDEQKAVRVSPGRKEDLVSGTSGITS